MRHSIQLQPLPHLRCRALNGARSSGSSPPELRTEHCSYCSEPLEKVTIPLMVWSAEGSCAEFCDACQGTW
jgi:hypothetical protein